MIPCGTVQARARPCSDCLLPTQPSCGHLRKKMIPAAYREGHLACAKDLLRARAYPDLADNQGRTPLYWAVANGHPTTVRVLLQHRADPQVTTLVPDTKRKVKDDTNTTVEGSGATQLANLLELAHQNSERYADSPMAADYQETYELLLPTSNSSSAERFGRREDSLILADAFRSETEMAEWLKLHDVDTSSWGQGSSKSVAHLYHEIQEHESMLSFDSKGVIRTVAVVRVNVFLAGRPELVLREARQVFPCHCRSPPSSPSLDSGC